MCLTKEELEYDERKMNEDRVYLYKQYKNLRDNSPMGSKLRLYYDGKLLNLLDKMTVEEWLQI